MKPCQHLSGKGRDDGLGAGEYDSVVGWCQLASLRIAAHAGGAGHLLGTRFSPRGRLEVERANLDPNTHPDHPVFEHFRAYFLQ